jgi:hypothetical protein
MAIASDSVRPEPTYRRQRWRYEGWPSPTSRSATGFRRSTLLSTELLPGRWEVDRLLSKNFQTAFATDPYLLWRGASAAVR